MREAGVGVEFEERGRVGELELEGAGVALDVLEGEGGGGWFVLVVDGEDDGAEEEAAQGRVPGAADTDERRSFSRMWSPMWRMISGGNARALRMVMMEKRQED